MIPVNRYTLRAACTAALLACTLPCGVIAQPLPLLAGASPAPAPASAPGNPLVLNTLPLRQTRLHFKDLGVGSPITLRGTEGSADLGLSVRLDELVEAATLHLTFTLSPALLPDLSHLQVMINDEVLQTVRVDKALAGRPQTLDLPLDPRYFTDYNRLRFKLIGHYTLECEFPTHTSLWASISNDSYIDLNLRQLPLRDDLALLPAPFFDPRDNRPVDVTLITSRHPAPGVLKASGSLASWLGVLAAYRGNRFQVLQDALPTNRHAIVLATNADRPAFLKDIGPVQQPTLRVIANPQAPAYKVLLLLGRDDVQVEQVAQTLTVTRPALSGPSLVVNRLELPAPRQAYDAPRWLDTRRPVQLAELIQSNSDLQLRGPVLDGVVRINTRMAPDLFTWHSQGVPMDLYYRYTPTNLSDRGSLDLAINDQFVHSYPLEATRDASSGVRNILLPLMDNGSYQAHSDFKYPAFLIGGDNQLQFAFKIPPSDFGRCQSTSSPELRAAVDPQSTIDLSGFHHYLAMPNLVAYANSGFPFTKYADLAQTSVILPDQPTPGDIELYLSAMARMGVSTGYPGTRFRLLSASHAAQAQGTDLLIISHAGADALLSGWQHHLPALLEAGKRSLRPLDKTLGLFDDLFSLEPERLASAEHGSAVLEGQGTLGAIVGFASPLDAQRDVVTLIGSDAEAQHALALALNAPGKVSLMRGDLALLRGDSLESFRINDIHYVGDLPWWRRVWFHLHNHPVLLALAGIVTGLFLSFVIYVALRLRARRRLGLGA